MKFLLFFSMPNFAQVQDGVAIGRAIQVFQTINAIQTSTFVICATKPAAGNNVDGKGGSPIPLATFPSLRNDWTNFYLSTSFLFNSWRKLGEMVEKYKHEDDITFDRYLRLKSDVIRLSGTERVSKWIRKTLHKWICKNTYVRGGTTSLHSDGYIINTLSQSASLHL